MGSASSKLEIISAYSIRSKIDLNTQVLKQTGLCQDRSQVILKV